MIFLQTRLSPLAINDFGFIALRKATIAAVINATA
jgi:hypothetical protein